VTRAACQEPGPTLQGVGDVTLAFFDRRFLNEGTDDRALLQSIANLERPRRISQPLRETLRDASCARIRLAETQVWPQLRYSWRSRP